MPWPAGPAGTQVNLASEEEPPARQLQRPGQSLLRGRVMASARLTRRSGRAPGGRFFWTPSPAFAGAASAGEPASFFGPSAACPRGAVSKGRRGRLLRILPGLLVPLVQPLDDGLGDIQIGGAVQHRLEPDLRWRWLRRRRLAFQRHRLLLEHQSRCRSPWRTRRWRRSNPRKVRARAVDAGIEFAVGGLSNVRPSCANLSALSLRSRRSGLPRDRFSISLVKR